MIFETYPITGPLKEPLLIVEWLIVFFVLEIGILFLLRCRSEKIDKLKSIQERSYIWLFFGYGLMWIFRIIGDFFVDSMFLRAIIINSGYIIQIICVCVFIRIMELNRVYFKKNFFTKISIILAGIYIFVLITFLFYAYIISYFFWIIILIFFLFYFKNLYSHFYIKREMTSFRLGVFKFFIGFILIFIGFQLSVIKIFSDILGYEIRLIGDITQLIGLLVIVLFLFSIPSLNEYEWYDKIDSIFIMHKSGLFLYKRFFREEIVNINESIITGTLTSLKMMLENFTDSDITSIIKQKDKIFIIEPGKSVYGVLICDKELKSLKILLSKFIEKVEMIYFKVLTSWNGNLKIFKSIEDIANEFFYAH